jgi:hypothetical protein
LMNQVDCFANNGIRLIAAKILITWIILLLLVCPFLL